MFTHTGEKDNITTNNRCFRPSFINRELFIVFRFSHGSYECIGRRPEVHQQCRETRQASGVAPSLLEGDHQVPDGHDEAWIHWRVRDRRRSSIRQGCRQSDRSPEQMRSHFAPFRCADQRH